VPILHGISPGLIELNQSNLNHDLSQATKVMI